MTIALDNVSHEEHSNDARAVHSVDGAHRARRDRNDFRLIYGAAFVAFLISVPVRRMLSIHTPRTADGQRVSILCQVRGEACLVASYALMGF